MCDNYWGDVFGGDAPVCVCVSCACLSESVMRSENLPLLPTQKRVHITGRNI